MVTLKSNFGQIYIGLRVFDDLTFQILQMTLNFSIIIQSYGHPEIEKTL